MKAPKFREFISEAPDNGKYKLLVITDEPEKEKTFHTADRLREEAEKLGWKYYLYKLTGGYTTSPEGALRLHNKDCLLYTSPSPRDLLKSRMPSSA